MHERKSLRSQDSQSFTLTENGRALYRSDITCVRSKIIFIFCEAALQQSIMKSAIQINVN